MNATRHKVNQVFSFKDTAARSVLLAGDFTHWLKGPIPLQKHVGGVWRVTTSLTPGTYHYRFLVDGEWRDDPECIVRVQDPFGTQNGVAATAHKPEKTQTAPEAARVWGF
jgi:1,4-alpha-glucan branching enzyme